ncbi:pumilio homolog 12-like [Vigna umbellata]|uniref:pumilio homolog 12-like n=1 Tax=Vigna umbellata TaxID=87088 RepID=UPI001F5E51CB|nr:pumilio homolog 12-like [Vigna umbellata]
MEKCVSASSSPYPSPPPEIKHVVDSAESTPKEGFFSPLIQSHTNLDSLWKNSISVDALSCSMARLCFTATPPLISPNCSTALCCHCSAQFLQHHTSSALQDVKAQFISVTQMPRQQLGKPDVMEKIFSQLKDHFCDLMMDQHCDLSILAILQASSVHHITRILHLVIQNQHKLKELCMHNHGSLVFQKLLEHLKTPDQISAVIFAVKRICVRLSKNINGGHVINHCLKLFSPALTTFIIDEVAENCVEIATDKSGCSTLQKCLHHAKDNSMKRLIQEIVSHASLLTEHPFGNYAVQYVAKMKIPGVNAEIMLQLKGRYAQLSMNKHASNVVEHLLEFSEEKDAADIIQELMYTQNFLRIIQDPYGNYVVQRALQNCKGNVYKMLSTIILLNYPYLHTHPYGKRVLTFVQRRKNYEQRHI